MVDVGAITHMEDGDTAVPRSAPKSVLVLGGGIEIPCKYVRTKKTTAKSVTTEDKLSKKHRRKAKD